MKQIFVCQSPNLTGNKSQGGNFHKMVTCGMMVYLEVLHNEHRILLLKKFISTLMDFINFVIRCTYIFKDFHN